MTDVQKIWEEYGHDFQVMAEVIIENREKICELEEKIVEKDKEIEGLQEE